MASTISFNLEAAAICPACYTDTPLQWSPHEVSCTECGAKYIRAHGISYFIVPDASWRAVLQDTIALFHDYTANRDRASASRPLDEALERQRATCVQLRDAVFWSIWDPLKIPLTASILEIGAGDLRLAADIARRGYQPVALEPTPECLRYEGHAPGPGITRICGSAMRLPFRSQQFDVVLVHACLHHMSQIVDAVREMGRVLKTGGRLLIIEEPVSPIFSNDERRNTWVPNPAFDIGIHETVPRWRTYVKACAAAQAPIKQVQAPVEDLALPHALRPYHKIRDLLHKTLTSHKAGRPLLNLVYAQVSIIAEKSARKITSPTPLLPADWAFDPADYVLRRDRQTLVKLWRSVLNPAEIPAEIEVGRNDVYHLRRGFSRRETSGARPFRYMFFEGAFILKLRSNCPLLELRYEGPESIQVFQDGDLLPLQQSREGSATFRLLSNQENQISEFQITCDAATQVGHDLVTIKFYSARTTTAV